MQAKPIRFNMQNALRHPVTTWLLALALALVVGAAHAQPRTAADAGWAPYEPTRFVVSGILSLKTESTTIKPVHVVVQASADTEALAAFIKVVERDYPEYDLVSTLASPVPPAATCRSNL